MFGLVYPVGLFAGSLAAVATDSFSTGNDVTMATCMPSLDLPIASDLSPTDIAWLTCAGLHLLLGIVGYRRPLGELYFAFLAVCLPFHVASMYQLLGNPRALDLSGSGRDGSDEFPTDIVVRLGMCVGCIMAIFTSVVHYMRQSAVYRTLDAEGAIPRQSRRYEHRNVMRHPQAFLTGMMVFLIIPVISMSCLLAILTTNKNNRTFTIIGDMESSDGSVRSVTMNDKSVFYPIIGCFLTELLLGTPRFDISLTAPTSPHAPHPAWAAIQVYLLGGFSVVVLCGFVHGVCHIPQKGSRRYAADSDSEGSPLREAFSEIVKQAMEEEETREMQFREARARQENLHGQESLSSDFTEDPSTESFASSSTPTPAKKGRGKK